MEDLTARRADDGAPRDPGKGSRDVLNGGFSGGPGEGSRGGSHSGPGEGFSGGLSEGFSGGLSEGFRGGLSGGHGPRRTGRHRDLLALVAWLATRLGVVLVAVHVSAETARPFLDRWTQWDVGHLVQIARYGYAGESGKPRDGGLVGFFPGFPLVLRALHVIVPDWRLGALLVTLVAGGVASVALARLGDQEAGDGTGPFAIVAMLLSPFAVFLFAGYSEALFLAFAVPAWMLARRRRWELAALCALAAGTVRITGLFLGIALVLEFLLGDRRWRKLPWLALAFVGPAGYFGYLWWWSGDPLAWQHAQERHWGRTTTSPVQAFKTTWNAAFGSHDMFTGAFRVELAAAAVGVALTAYLLLRRRWAESAYVGLQMAAFLTSSYYLSIGRATLLWWPLWLMVGGLAVKAGRGGWVYAARLSLYVVLLGAMVPLLVVQIVHFTEGAWTG